MTFKTYWSGGIAVKTHRKYVVPDSGPSEISLCSLPTIQQEAYHPAKASPKMSAACFSDVQHLARLEPCDMLRAM